MDTRKNREVAPEFNAQGEREEKKRRMRRWEKQYIAIYIRKGRTKDESIGELGTNNEEKTISLNDLKLLYKMNGP